MGDRHYVALPYEYREELESLSDAAFGKLVRGLMEYSMFGVEPENLPKSARILWPRLRGREDRYRAAFSELDRKRHDKAVRAANARWNSLRSAEDAERMQADDGDMQADDGDMQADAWSMHEHAKNANTNTNTETESETETKTKTNFYSKTDPQAHRLPAASTGTEPPHLDEAARLRSYITYLRSTDLTETASSAQYSGARSPEAFETGP